MTSAAFASISPPKRSPSLSSPRKGEQEGTVPKGARWATLGFMLAIHLLAAYALLPQFWSLPALASLLVLWGIPLRLVLVYHITWLVNSATHCWGSIAYPSGDGSRNNPWVAALTFGEGWHNNHHAFPHSAKHGLQPGQIDLTWQHIRLLKALGLATKVRLPAGAVG
ncbi:MAG: acyl-CoA desaturase [Synechococcaceae bacterium WB7_1B_046]|nr:acyl-CoA desaturase [Synechococcaceae bacterium WB7_1B_046]